MMKKMKVLSIILATGILALSGNAAVYISEDFESGTVGSQPAADDLSPSSNTADNFNKVINSVANKAGTGQGLEFYDNNGSVGTRLGYDFSSGKSSIRYDVSFAALNTNGVNSDYVSVGVLANGASAGSSANRYAEVRLMDDGAIRFYSGGAYISGSKTAITLDTAYTLSMYVNDSDVEITDYSGTNDLAANSVDFWLDGSLLYSGALNTVSAATTNGLGRIGFASSSGDLGLDYAFDNISVSSIIEEAPSAYLLDESFESGTVGSQPVADDVRPSSNTTDNFNKVINSAANKAGTDQGVEFYDNSGSAGTRLSYDFSTGESAIRYDVSLAALSTSGSSSDYITASVVANGAATYSSANYYCYARLYGNGSVRFYSADGHSSTTSININTAHTLSMYVNDSDSGIANYSGTRDLAANSVDFWLDGSYLYSGSLYTPSDSTTNGLGRIGFSSTTSGLGLDYAFDDLKVSIVVAGDPGLLLAETYESWTVGSAPDADDLSPSTPASDLAVVVVGGSTNIAGTGNAVSLLDDNTGGGIRLGYDMVDGASNQLSAARVDFSFAALSTTNSGDRLNVAVGEYGVNQSSSSSRFLDCRLYADGTIDFVSTLGESSYDNDLLASNNTLSIFINDLDADAITYTGPDDATYVLQTNSVAYWLNGSLVLETLMENRTTANGTVFSSTNNIGRFGFASISSDYGLDYVVDDILITTNGLTMNPAAADPYADWADSYGLTGGPGDDADSDGLSNFGEYVFDGDPRDPEGVGDQGVQPTLDAGNYIFSLRADTSLSYIVLTNPDLVNGTWGTNAGPVAVTADDGGMDSYTNSIGTSADQLFIRLIIEQN